jgi:hypothetical protein
VRYDWRIAAVCAFFNSAADGARSGKITAGGAMSGDRTSTSGWADNSKLAK